MSNTQQHQPHTIIDLLTTLDTSGARLVYLYLRIEGKATIDEMQRALGMRKLSSYSPLQTLTTTDLVERAGAAYVRQEPTPDGGNA